MAQRELEGAFPDYDKAVLSYIAAVISDGDTSISERRRAAIDLLVSAGTACNEAEARCGVADKLETVASYLFAGDDNDSNPTTDDDYVPALDRRHCSIFGTRVPKAWDALAEVTWEIILEGYGDALALVRAASTCRSLAAIACKVVAASASRRCEESAAAQGASRDAVAVPSGAALLGHLGETLRGTRLLKGEVFPERRRLPGSSTVRLSCVRLIPGTALLLVTAVGRTRVYCREKGSNRSQGALLPHAVMSKDDPIAGSSVPWPSSYSSAFVVAVGTQTSAGSICLFGHRATFEPMAASSERPGEDEVMAFPPLLERSGRVVAVDLSATKMCGGSSFVLVSASSQRHGKRTVVKIWRGASLEGITGISPQQVKASSFTLLALAFFCSHDV